MPIFTHTRDKNGKIANTNKMKEMSNNHVRQLEKRIKRCGKRFKTFRFFSRLNNSVFSSTIDEIVVMRMFI